MLVGGHTEVTPAVNRPVVIGQMLGLVERGRIVTTAGCTRATWCSRYAQRRSKEPPCSRARQRIASASSKGAWWRRHRRRSRTPASRWSTRRCWRPSSERRRCTTRPKAASQAVLHEMAAAAAVWDPRRPRRGALVRARSRRMRGARLRSMVDACLGTLLAAFAAEQARRSPRSEAAGHAAAAIGVVEAGTACATRTVGRCPGASRTRWRGSWARRDLRRPTAA